MDVLADVLDITHLANKVLGHAQLLPPWGVTVDLRSIAVVHVMQRGRAFLRMACEPQPRRIDTGDIVLLPRGSLHTLSDSPRGRARPYQVVIDEMRQRIEGGEASPDMSLVLCAAYMFEHDGPHPLIGLLPDLIHLRRAHPSGDRRLELLVDLLLAESTQPQSGTELVVPRLLDSLLVFIVRAWVAAQPTGAAGWFGALRDPALRRTLELIHQRPGHPWTIEELASHAAMSRPTLMRRFAALVGTSPGDYLTQWRMNLVAQLLRDTELSMDRISERAGYTSAAALSRAFKRRFGQAPSRYREGVLAGRGSEAR